KHGDRAARCGLADDGSQADRAILCGRAGGMQLHLLVAMSVPGKLTNAARSGDESGVVEQGSTIFAGAHHRLGLDERALGKKGEYQFARERTRSESAEGQRAATTVRFDPCRGQIQLRCVALIGPLVDL